MILRPLAASARATVRPAGPAPTMQTSASRLELSSVRVSTSMAGPSIRVVTLEEAGLPLALKTGRATVDTPHFAVLDDDDELLPGALGTRLQALDEALEADVVVTNGYLQRFNRRDLNIADFGQVQADPLRALLRQN